MHGVLVRDCEESFEGSFVDLEMHYYIAHGKVSLFFPFVSWSLRFSHITRDGPAQANWAQLRALHE